MSFGSAFKSFTTHGICAVTSSIFGFFYITILFILACTKNLLSVSPAKPEKLPKPERKLIFDLSYYAKLQNFELETHEVKTSDGFFLHMNRLVAPETHEESKQRYPVLLIPGLMQSSSSFCTAGPQAVAFVLVRAGYDVWLGNNRGGFHPKHEKYKPRSSKMWEWSMYELATSDVPAMIHYVKAQTNAPKIAVGAHSQGTTQTFMALSTEPHGGIPDLGNSISSFSAMAPAVYAGPLIDRWFLRMLRVGHRRFHAMLGYRAFIGLMGDMRRWLPLGFFTYTGYVVFNYMLGWDDALWDLSYRNRNFIFAPVYVSSKLMFWWLGKGGFADRKCIFASEDTKWFDERFPPLELYACGRDNLVLPDMLINRIHNFEPEVRAKLRVISLRSYSHLDVLWAVDASEKVAIPMSEFIWENVDDKERWHTPVFVN